MSNHTSIFRRLSVAPLLAASALFLAACASAPPPTDAMTRWNDHRASPMGEAVADGQPGPVSKADAAYERAQRAHEEGDTVARAHNLRLADIHWRTAVARHKAAEEAEALAEARSAVAEREQTLADVEGRADALQASIVAARGDAVTAGARPMPTNDREKAEYTLDTAVVDMGRADEVGAETRAPLLFTKASLAYDEAARSYGQARYQQAVDRATEASRLARDAYEEALPRYRADALEERLQARRDELLNRLLRVGTPVISEGDISLSLIGYFPEDDESVRPDQRQALVTLADILDDFPEYSIKVVGHTDAAGHPTDNLMLSQARALAVRQVMEDNGVDRDRLTSIGKGEEDVIDIARGDVVNERIDVILEPREVRLVRELVGDARSNR